MVARLAGWYEAHRVELEQRGIDARLERSPNDGRPKASTWLTMRRGPAEAEIIVWESGECELWVQRARKSFPAQIRRRSTAS